MQQSEELLASVRLLMKEHGIDALIVTDKDPHLSDSVSDHWRVISWLTGFTGSAGTVVITGSFAGLWTDSRYSIQAENQLSGSGFVLMKSKRKDGNDFIDWLVLNLNAENQVGLDGSTISTGRLKKLNKSLAEKSIKTNIEFDIIPELWNDRPPAPVFPAFDHPVSFSGKSRSEKIAEVREEMKKRSIDYHLLTSPDDIMWLLNIRGRDLRYSPLLLSFAIIDEDQILLFAEESKIPLMLAREFDNLGIVLLPYEETAGILSSLQEGLSILVSPAVTSASLYEAIPKNMKIIEDISIPSRYKSIKNNVEIENIREVMIRDGVALTRFFCWIEQNSGQVPMSELSLKEKLFHFRSGQENFLSLSFSSIVAYNEHGALPHYSATSETDAVIGQDGLLLVDSGSQYHDGTTDITRTVATGTPSSGQIKDFTLVLKGMIDLAMAKFPVDTNGSQLDILARKALWREGLNYGHGTGHGVGFCLNVHEGPQSISPGADHGKVIRAGMLTSDEPAIYREGEYGIRIENLILCREDEDTQFGNFLAFETMSLCYIDKSLIDKLLLTPGETEWLNSYHASVYEKLHQHLTTEEKEWLKGKTTPL